MDNHASATLKETIAKESAFTAAKIRQLEEAGVIPNLDTLETDAPLSLAERGAKMGPKGKATLMPTLDQVCYLDFTLILTLSPFNPTNPASPALYHE